MPADGAQWLLTELVDVMEADGAAIDEETLTTLRAAVEEGDIKAALQQLATLEGTAGEWRIEALSTVSDDAIAMVSEMEGYLLSFFFRSKGDGSMIAIAVQLPMDRDAEVMQAAAVEALTKVVE